MTSTWGKWAVLEIAVGQGVTVRDVQLWRESAVTEDSDTSGTMGGVEIGLIAGRFIGSINVEKLPVWVNKTGTYRCYSESWTTCSFFRAKLLRRRHKYRGLVVELSGRNGAAKEYVVFYKQLGADAQLRVCCSNLDLSVKRRLDRKLVVTFATAAATATTTAGNADAADAAAAAAAVTGPTPTSEPASSLPAITISATTATATTATTTTTTPDAEESSTLSPQQPQEPQQTSSLVHIDTVIHRTQLKRTQSSIKLHSLLRKNDHKQQFVSRLSQCILGGLRLRNIPHPQYEKLYKMTYGASEFSFRNELATQQEITFEQIQNCVEILLKLFTRS
ncbi:Sld7p Ecym_4057 [Eremothecium cymbalariae DBVPG|uniref:Mitochondrial morphogenesis protein SLD7 n=1 Tax=Eremothecium cymbalariae (strain CBS 270.75 / DBVPG 7215 / KCTC 17166 / NRRL Y-17582) TaxID=931890 RepID=G8JSY5_ERECY|nr:hypothetical protein Ecym_4057 [Eremothecium cymbalariae DBVPG\